MIEDVLLEFLKVRVFIKVDVRNGYWYVVFEEELVKFIIFDILFGCYYWKRLFFGFKCIEFFYLGYLVIKEGLKLDLDKIKVV